MQSGNPVLRNKKFGDLGGPLAQGEPMTMDGVVGKTALLLILLLGAGGWTWVRFGSVLAEAGPQAALAAVSPFIWGGLIAGLVLALITSFASRFAHITAPLYAIAQGFALGGLSAFFELRFPGIVMQAVALTVAVMVAMLLLYRSRVIRVTDKLRSGIVVATLGVALFYLVDLGLRAFTSIQVPMIHESGTVGIVFSLFVVGLAALNLLLDFDLIEQGVAGGAPRQMEWYGAFGLVVTLVWLYLELLRLLSKLRR